MAGLTYLLLNGKRQGLILKACLTQNSVGDKALAAHLHLHIPHNIHHTGEEPQESVYFSLAFRAIELIFKKEYTLVDFFGDVIMDTAKTLVSTVVAVAVGGVISLICPFVIVTTALAIVIGIILNWKLNKLDSTYGWSTQLKVELQRAFAEEQRIRVWNNNHTGYKLPLFFNLHN